MRVRTAILIPKSIKSEMKQTEILKSYSTLNIQLIPQLKTNKLYLKYIVIIPN